ncbi:MAG: glycerol-3-phosphate acyltransferase, partial [Acidimicrobiia bacterium]
MSLALALFAGYVIGSIPTANAISGLFGFDLRSEGSGNPGANNARRLGGPRLFIAILAVEAAKGAAAVLAGDTIAGSPGMVAAGLGAATGNVFNVWYRFQGGKGLGITLGVLLLAWPLALPPVIVTIAAVALITRSTGLASIGALVMLLILGLLWFPMAWSIGWGAESTSLPWMAIGLAVVLAPKHISDASGAR